MDGGKLLEANCSKRAAVVQSKTSMLNTLKVISLIHKLGASYTGVGSTSSWCSQEVRSKPTLGALKIDLAVR